MRKILHITAMTLALRGASALIAQNPPAQVPIPAPDAAGKTEVTYAKVKEFTPGQKIVLDVDNAIDKTFDLNDRQTTVSLVSDLKVGDAVKIVERNLDGKKVYEITRHTKGAPESPAKN